MAPKRLNLTYALKDGLITHISQVERGIKCGCYCPACGDKLIAKKGQSVIHHFAHQASKDCEYSYESSLHFAAKEILSRSRKMLIPPVSIHFPNSYKKDILLHDTTEITIDRVELEHRFDNVVPDVVIYVGTKRLYIEIFVAHRVDKEKLHKLQEANISTIEIDLSKLDHSITTEELTALLTENNNSKNWLYNAFAHENLRKFYYVADWRKIISKEFYTRVDGCPIAVRSWHGKAYANLDDCLGCEYCISHTYKGGILCSGRQRVSSIQDIKTLESLRKDKPPNSGNNSN